MPLLLRPARAEDAPAMGVLGTRAFQDGLNRVLFPPRLQTPGNKDEGPAWRAARILRRMREGRTAYVVVDAADDGSETVIGYAQWDRPKVPGQDTPQDEPAKEDDTPSSLDKEALARLNEILDKIAVTALGPDGFQSMWCRCSASLTNSYISNLNSDLVILSVDPDHQRRGAGRMLVQWGMEQAAAEGKKVFVIATPEGKPLYEAMGFEAIADPVDLLGFPNQAMLWIPTSYGS